MLYYKGKVLVSHKDYNGQWFRTNFISVRYIPKKYFLTLITEKGWWLIFLPSRNQGTIKVMKRLTMSCLRAWYTLSMVPEINTSPFLCGATVFGSGKWMTAPVTCIICLIFMPLRPMMNKWCCGAISNCMDTGNGVWS